MTTESAPTTWVVGVGGIGAVIAARLAPHDDVLLVDGWEDNVDAINGDGLVVEYAAETVVARIRAVRLDDLAAQALPEPHLVILAVKSYQTAPVISLLAPLIGPTTQVLSAQNGLNEDTIAEAVGADRTVGAICLFDGQLTSPGRARQRRTDGKLVIGGLRGDSDPRLDAVAQRLRSAVEVESSDNIYGELWTKVIRNGMINGVCALLGCDVGTAVADDDALSIIVALGVEGVRVAHALDVSLVEAELYGAAVADFAHGFDDASSFERAASHVRAEYTRFGKVVPSMAQDVANARTTEIEFLNGALVAKGAALGVPTDVNAAMVEAITRIQGAPHDPNDGGPTIDAIAAIVTQLRNGPRD